MIISASRRTDIPAFYSKWFINRIRSGYLLTQNPFNTNQVRKISLKPNDVDVIVFWTRNAKPLIKHLDELDKMGFKYYFQYTITGYRKELEHSTPHPLKAIEAFIELSDKIGKEKVIWRYDPIILTEFSSVSEHVRLFEKTSNSLKNKTDKVIISFADFYKNTQRNLANIYHKDILSDKNNLDIILKEFSSIAKSRNMQIETCSEKIDLQKYNIKHGKCIDNKLIKKLFDIDVDSSKDKNQRKECECIKSVDIGIYNTCLHGCSYCYATHNQKMVKNNIKKHNPNSPLLIGSFEDLSEQVKIKLKNERTLFDF